MSPVWYVVFHPKQKGHWWGRRFSHVSLAGWTNETWIHLDVGRFGAEVASFYAHDEVNDFLSFNLAHRVMVRVGIREVTGGFFGRPMTCVSFVKHVLGVRSRALLPDQLFRTLTEDQGFEVVNVRVEAEGNRGTEAGEAPGRG